MYARDLKFLLDREASKTRQLEAANKQLERYALDLKQSVEEERQRRVELDRAYYDTLLRLTRAAEYRDGETGFHMNRISGYARVLGLQLQFGAEEAEALAAAAPLHDVGKIGVPDRVLFEPGPLCEADLRIMEQHTVIGAALLEGSASELLELGRTIALTHHERWDGSGYPQGLAGEAIPMVGRIVMLCDQYDALRSVRPYKEPFGHTLTCRILLEGDNRTRPAHFDPVVLAAFETVNREFETVFEGAQDPA
jgi:putative two-component system response regulator